MRNPEAEKTQFLKSAFKSVTPLKSVFSFFISAIPYTLGKIAGQQWSEVAKASAPGPPAADVVIFFTALLSFVGLQQKPGHPPDQVALLEEHDQQLLDVVFEQSREKGSSPQ